MAKNNSKEVLKTAFNIHITFSLLFVGFLFLMTVITLISYRLNPGNFIENGFPILHCPEPGNVAAECASGFQYLIEMGGPLLLMLVHPIFHLYLLPALLILLLGVYLVQKTSLKRIYLTLIPPYIVLCLISLWVFNFFSF